MITEGDDAPRFELPALVDGAHRRVGLDEYLGEDVIILAFYPGDFNPACDEESDLDELDLFTMQKDVTVLGISADTLYSHEAFADEYDLHVPLLSDTRRQVAERYGVTFTDEVGQELIERAVFVVDHDGVVQHAWSTQEMTALPDVDAIKDAIAETGGDDTAFARYRVGYAHYTEGRRAFTSAMGSYQESEWMLSQSDFKRSQAEFEEAAEHFDSAARFVEDPDLGTYYEQAEEKATALWQAAEWLTESASNYSSGAGAEGQQLRDDAERPLETARDIGEPVDPNDWPPDLDADEEGGSILPEGETADTELAVDIDEVAADSEPAQPADTGASDDPVPADDPAAGDGNDSPADAAADAGDDEIDDEELEEIEAELAANQPDDPEGEAIDESPTSMVDAPPGVDETDEEEEIDDEALERLEADLEASQSAAEEAQARPDAAEVDDSSAADTAADPLSPDTDDEPDVAPPGSGSLEPAGGDGGSSTGERGTLEPSGDAGGDRKTFADITGGDASDSDDDLGEPTGASDEAPEDITDAEELDEPDGATDEDMAAIPTEDELAEDDDEDESADDAAY